MKKLIALLLAAVMAFGACTFAAAEETVTSDNDSESILDALGLGDLVNSFGDSLSGLGDMLGSLEEELSGLKEKLAGIDLDNLNAQELVKALGTEELGYTETVVSIDAGDHQIPATICAPAAEGKYPCVVMLHGTGSSRDEAGNGYAIAAPILADSFGIATIRIDFMGSGDSTASYEGYTFESAVGDAVAAANYVTGLDNIDGDAIGVMGWSQGGTDALLAAGENPEIFKAIVTWAGAPDLSSMLTDELYEEAKQNGHFVMTFDWRDSLNVSLQWCEDVKNTDVLAVFSNSTAPVCAIAGKEDTTVDPEWSNKIVEASNSPVKVTYFIDGMDHTFNVFTEEDHKSLLEAVSVTGLFFDLTLNGIEG